MITLAALNTTPQKEKQFNKKGIYTANDLARFFPRKYLDFTRETGILPETEVSCLTVHINSVKSYRGNVPVLNAIGTTIPDGKPIKITWFHMIFLHSYVAGTIGKDVFVTGKVTYDEKWETYQITQPTVFHHDIESSKRIHPVYSKIANMSDDYLTTRIKEALAFSDVTKETLPAEIINRYDLLPMEQAMNFLHMPNTMKDVNRGQSRIMFDELLYFALKQEWANRDSAVGSPFSVKTYKLMNSIKEALPFSLTQDQESTVTEILAHIKQGKRTNALIQGDVGSGKTIVAFLLMAAFAGSGYQAVLMAPTKVLARQHYKDLCELVSPHGYEVAYLGEELKMSERKREWKRISSGEVKFIVGTHSVFGSNVVYKNLAITITDEEHKFGIAQRNALMEKASLGVHSVTMSATPIPRSLAQVIYGSYVQLHTIMTKPAGRLPIQTGVAVSRERIYRFIRSQHRKGHQIYVVCPMIDGNERAEGVASIETTASEYHAALDADGIRIEILTGKMKKEEAQEVIDRFKNGDIDVLISTTVIEVGVNVPNATGIIISSAERFGLAQLHQLRGRVGRGNHQSYCVLESATDTQETNERFKAMCETADGFEIAKADLAIRGAGDFIGTKQSGKNKYLALMLAYPETYQKAQEAASLILDDGIDCPILEKVREEEQLAED